MLWNDLEIENGGSDAVDVAETFDHLILPPTPADVASELGVDIVAFAQERLGFVVEPSPVELLTSTARRGNGDLWLLKHTYGAARVFP